MLYIQPKYFKNSSPERVIEAPEGSIFIRVNEEFYLIKSPSTVANKLLLTKRIFLMAYHTADWFQVIQENQIFFEQPYEVWHKASGGTSVTGWKFIGYYNYFINKLPDPSQTPTPTPTITATFITTPTPTPTITQTPTLSQTETPTPTPSQTASPTLTPTSTLIVTPTPTPTPTQPELYGIDNIESYPTGSISSLYDTSSWAYTGSLVPWGNDYESDLFETYPTGSITTLTFGWIDTGSIGSWGDLYEVDNFESYSTGSITSLTSGWTLTGSISTWE